MGSFVKKISMSQAVRQLHPQEVWNHFADLNAVPRPSKKESRVIAFMKEFGNSLGLPTEEDEIGNVLIRKPATPGMEDRPTVILQAHLDMVHQKNNDTVFDFDSEGIRMRVEGEWVKAEGTTLGADNGLGVACIMAILSTEDIPHPALEALFTIDEETGMTGAKELRQDWLTGSILLNLDTEEDDEIGIGCAGGVDVTAKATYHAEPVDGPLDLYRLEVKGLQGGHSGMDIHKGLGNANKLMNRLLLGLDDFIRIQSIHGGSLRNAIPRESVAIMGVSPSDSSTFEDKFEKIHEDLHAEYGLLEPDLKILLQRVDGRTDDFMPHPLQTKLLKVLATLHNGVYRMSPGIADLVETSNNIAKVVVDHGHIQVDCLTRSSVESSKWDLANSLRAAFELGGMQVAFGGNYPGWAPNMESTILHVLDQVYTERFGEKAHIAACHAGLECGILGERYPGLDMISFGPTIKGAHSPDERASISSLQKFWGYLQEVLQRIPVQ
jgi:dipeptidase D